MLLLAVVTGLPAVSARVCTAIQHPANPGDRLGTITSRIEASARTVDERTQARSLTAWLGQGPVMRGHWAQHGVRDMARWVEPIARFSFRSEVAASAEPLGGGDGTGVNASRAAVSKPRAGKSAPA
jgi:hypothetical protein